jgi:uncharacterized membrane protein
VRREIFSARGPPLSLGPANIVVPIHGMFIIGGPLLAVLFLREALRWSKIAGLVTVVVGGS